MTFPALLLSSYPEIGSFVPSDPLETNEDVGIYIVNSVVSIRDRRTKIN